MSASDPFANPHIPTRARSALLFAFAATALLTITAATMTIPAFKFAPTWPWLGSMVVVGVLALTGIIVGMTVYERDLRAQWGKNARDMAQTSAPAPASSFADHRLVADQELNLVLAPDTLATFRELIALVEASTALLERQRAVMADTMRAQAAVPRSVAYDPLTGAVAHTALMTRLTSDVAFACEHDRPIAVAVFDIDNFRAINAQHGHRFGDEVLFAVAERLRTKLGTGNLLARLGADHFAVVWPGLTRHEAQFRVEAMLLAVAKDLVEITLADGTTGAAVATVRVTMRAGLALCPDEALTAHDLIAAAEHAISGNPLAPELVHHDIPTTMIGEYHPWRAIREPSSPLRDQPAPTPWPNEYIEQMAQKHSSIHALTSALEAHDSSSVLHARSLAELAQATATKLGRPIEEARLVGLAALLHDVGSLGIPTEILNKAEPLSVEEWSFVREHPHLGERLLSSVGGVMAAVAPIVASHRERWDGSGYPVGLVGEAIPLGARIVAVCDVYGALISERPYRTSFTHDQAMAELERYAGSQFDPQVIAAFCHAVQA